ncbi:MAG: folate-binding protein YgfZ [Alphaproteobacteria bacterium]|nr:folate-binding protein YgfZ [Alphaproteobacteria bacterium]
MTDTSRVALEGRGVLAIDGPDARAFLQGIITNDIDQVDRACAIYAALLTPQGKFLFDFFIADDGDGGLLLDTRRDRLDTLVERLDFYRLRAKVRIRDVSEDWRVSALIGDEAARIARLVSRPGNARRAECSIIMIDPRLAALGVRVVHPVNKPVFAEIAGMSPGAYDAHRLDLSVGEATLDFIVEKSFALESNFDHLNAIDFTKGCYVGQELTARTRYRGTVRRRLYRVVSTDDGSLPDPGTLITAGKTEIGEMRSSRGTTGIALIRMDRLEEAGDREIRAGTAALVAERPGWFPREPAPAD